MLWGHHRIPPHHLVSTFRPGHLVIDLVSTVEADKKQVTLEYQQKLASLEQDLDNTLNALAGNLSALTPLQAVETRQNAAGQLRQQLHQQLAVARSQANSFFGSPPEHKTFKEFQQAISRPGAPEEPRAAWLASYKAEFEAKRIEKMIGRLRYRELQLQLERAAVLFANSKANSVSNLIRQADETLIRFNTAQHRYQLAKTQLQSLLQAFERHKHDDVAPSAALAHAAELELETSALMKTQLDMRLVHLAADLDRGRLQGLSPWIEKAVTSPGEPVPRTDELMQLRSQILAAVAQYDQQVPGEKLIIEQLQDSADLAIRAAFDEQAHLSALSGATPSNTPVTFQAWTASTTHPLVLAPSRGGTAHFEAAWESFSKLITDAADVLFKASLRGLGQFVSLMTYSAFLGNGERMGVTVPLVQMTPGTDLALEANRQLGQTLALPLRLSVAPAGGKSEIYMVATNGETVLRDVRVASAEWDAGQGAYRFTSQGPGAATILWHPQTPPSTLFSQNPKTGVLIPGSPIVEDLQKHYPGSISVPREAAGAPIPARIAEKLRGRRFSRFDKLREAIWMEIVADEIFRMHLSRVDIQNMENGTAPFSRKEDRVGKRIKLEIHHKHEIAEGGEVYDLDNLVLMTPKVHIDEHRGSNP